MSTIIPTGQKIAILQDYDGPLFVPEPLVDAVIKFLKITKETWDTAYNEEKTKNGSYVDVGKVFTKVAGNKLDELWGFLPGELHKSIYCPEANKVALRALLKLENCHLELITQGNKRLQELKLKSTGIESLIIGENKGYSVTVVEEDKTKYLEARFDALIKDDYTVIQIDDRSGPINKLREHASTYMHEHNIPESRFIQYRLQVGKYKDKEKLEYPLGAAVKEINDRFGPRSHQETYGGGAGRRK